MLKRLTASRQLVPPLPLELPTSLCKTCFLTRCPPNKYQIRQCCYITVMFKHQPSWERSGRCIPDRNVCYNSQPGGDILGLQVEEALHMTAGWQAYFRLRLWHCGGCFITAASALAVSRLTWSCIWPVKHRWCVCLRSSHRLTLLCLGFKSNAQFSKRATKF